MRFKLKKTMYKKYAFPSNSPNRSPDMKRISRLAEPHNVVQGVASSAQFEALSKKGKVISQEEADSVSNRLYENHERQIKWREETKSEKDKREKLEMERVCTFKPKINRNYVRTNPGKKVNISGKSSSKGGRKRSNSPVQESKERFTYHTDVKSGRQFKFDKLTGKSEWIMQNDKESSMSVLSSEKPTSKKTQPSISSEGVVQRMERDKQSRRERAILREAEARRRARDPEATFKPDLSKTSGQNRRFFRNRRRRQQNKFRAQLLSLADQNSDEDDYPTIDSDEPSKSTWMQEEEEWGFPRSHMESQRKTLRDVKLPPDEVGGMTPAPITSKKTKKTMNAKSLEKADFATIKNGDEVAESVNGYEEEQDKRQNRSGIVDRNVMMKTKNPQLSRPKHIEEDTFGKRKPQNSRKDKNSTKKTVAK